MEFIDKQHECIGKLKYRFYRRYLMAHYPKIALKLLGLIEGVSYNAIQKELEKQGLGFGGKYEPVWDEYQKLWVKEEAE